MDYSLSDIRSITEDKDKSSFYLVWLILIFLFFFAFSGNGLLGGGNSSGLEQTQRDILTSACNTQKEVFENRFATQMGFQQAQYQMDKCCCDLKVAIHAEGAETRALINQQETDRLREENTRLREAVNNDAQSQYILGQLGRYVTNPPCNSCPCINNCGCGTTF